MKIKLSEAVATYNDNRKKGSLKMTNTHLSRIIDYEKMTDKALQEYLSHYNKGKYLCPVVILEEIQKLLKVSYEELLGVDKINRLSINKIVDFLIKNTTDSNIKDVELIRQYILYTKK